MLKWLFFIYLISPRVHACDLSVYDESFCINGNCNTTFLTSDSCLIVKQRLSQLFGRLEAIESSYFQTQLQDLIYLDEAIVSIQVQQVLVGRKKHRQILLKQIPR